MASHPLKSGVYLPDSLGSAFALCFLLYVLSWTLPLPPVCAPEMLQIAPDPRPENLMLSNWITLD